jgi:hypothetical protein
MYGNCNMVANAHLSSSSDLFYTLSQALGTLIVNNIPTKLVVKVNIFLVILSFYFAFTTRII